MKNFKRFTALVIVLLLAVASFAGCGGKKSSDTASGDLSGVEVMTENKMPISEEGIKISMYLDNKSRGAVASYNDSPAMQKLQEVTGITIDFQHPVDTSTDKVALMINSGDLPDVILTSTYFYGGWRSAIVKEAAYDGVFVKLDEYIDKYAPNIKKFLATEDGKQAEKQIRMFNADNGIYTIPVVYSDESYNYYDGYFVRQDWLDKLNLGKAEDIRTIEDWEKVLTAFVEQDPNGNGQKDEVGFSSFAYMTKFVFMPAFDVFNWNYYLNPDTNKITHGVVEPGMKKFIEMICDWREKGLVNKDYASTDQKTLDYLVLNNKLGAFYCDYNNTAIKYVTANPDMDLKPVHMIANSKGKIRTGKIGKGVVSGQGALISAKSPYIEEIVRLFDYMYSEEGNAIGNWGVEGESYTVDANGNKVFTELITKNPDGRSVIDAYNWYTAAGVNGGIVPLFDNDVNKALNSSITEKQKELQDLATKYCEEADKCANLPSSPTTLEQDEEIAEISGDLDTYISENWAKFLTGEKKISEFDAFVKEVKKMGMDRVLDIKQEAYELGLENTKDIGK